MPINVETQRFIDASVAQRATKPEREQETAEQSQRMPIRTFSIQRTLKDIPEPAACPLCGGTTHKAHIPYWVRGTLSVVKIKAAPGYECEQCGTGLYDPLTDIELLTRAAALLDPVADLALRAVLYEGAAKLCRRLAQSQAPSSG